MGTGERTEGTYFEDVVDVHRIRSSWVENAGRERGKVENNNLDFRPFPLPFALATIQERGRAVEPDRMMVGEKDAIAI